MIDVIQKQIKELSDPEDYKYHLEKVVEYALDLSDKVNADRKVVELGAWLHDYGRLTIPENDPIHHETGATEGAEYMKELGVDADTIEKVKHCILSHRAREGDKPETLEAEVIANADAVSHFDIVPLLFWWGALSGKSYDESREWVIGKLKRDWDEKLTLPEAREMVEKKYKTLKEVLGYGD